jgi:ADP-ribose pyrophosphatase YjhB (NUDIX family)/ribosomal protein S18 acetylase RimI-like enzyme
MPTPDFILALRDKVGTDLLWLTGVSAVVRNDRGEVLLGRRVDTGQWALPSGILEPGEQPAVGLAREIEEETGVLARVEALVAVETLAEQAYPNGDRAQYLDLCFLARHVAGEARVNDDESLEVGWYAVDGLPEPLATSARHRLERALAHEGVTWFATGPAVGPTPAPAVPRPARGLPDVLAELPAGDRAVLLRRAVRTDVPAIVQLLADDVIGSGRESGRDLASYLDAFEDVDADPAHLLVVLEADGAVAGTMQLTFLPGLSRGGALRSQVEAVRVAPSLRGHGLGEAMLRWGIEESRRRGCAVVQLTTDKRRSDAQRFYVERLGFAMSHEGLKLDLGAGPAAPAQAPAP